MRLKKITVRAVSINKVSWLSGMKHIYISLLCSVRVAVCFSRNAQISLPSGKNGMWMRKPNLQVCLVRRPWPFVAAISIILIRPTNLG